MIGKVGVTFTESQLQQIKAFSKKHGRKRPIVKRKFNLICFLFGHSFEFVKYGSGTHEYGFYECKRCPKRK